MDRERLEATQGRRGRGGAYNRARDEYQDEREGEDDGTREKDHSRDPLDGREGREEVEDRRQGRLKRGAGEQDHGVQFERSLMQVGCWMGNREKR